MPNMQLIAADTPERRAELAALARVIWRQHYLPIIGADQVEYMLDTGYSKAALEAQQAAGTRFTLARCGERALAYAAVSPDPGRSDTAWLDKLYTHSQARGLGWGRRLVERAAEQARDFGAGTLRLRVNRHNATTIAVYRRMGFAVEAEDVKDIGYGYVMDDYVMAAPIALLLRR